MYVKNYYFLSSLSLTHCLKIFPILPLIFTDTCSHIQLGGFLGDQILPQIIEHWEHFSETLTLDPLSVFCLESRNALGEGKQSGLKSMGWIAV